MKRTLLVILACFLLNISQAMPAEEPLYPFEDTKGSVIYPVSKGWHREYEDNGDYGETWFFLTQTNEGGVLFASFTITNIGLRTYDATCIVNFYASGGKKYQLQKNYRRKDITGARDKLDVIIGPNRIWAEEKAYHMTVNEPELKLSMTFEEELPSFQFGNGRVYFYEDRSAEWGIGFHAPRASVRGTLTVKDKNFIIEGSGYHDHSWSTIKVPTFAKKWYTLRLFDQDASLILHQIYLTEEFGGGLLRLGLIGDNGQLRGTRDFRYEPVKWREDKKSGFKMPTEFEIFIKKDGYTLSGKVKEAQFLDSIDILEKIPWAIRILVKAFYKRPFHLRYLADCQIEMIDKTGERRHISALGLVETNVYLSSTSGIINLPTDFSMDSN